MARALCGEHGIVHLDLDHVAWAAPGVRKPLAESGRAIRGWVDDHPAWVMEGSYADLLEIAIPFCTELRFLNPGVEVCVANCRARPWEPEKYASKEAQDQMLDFLLSWVREYETRRDEYSLSRHREIYERFTGPKLEITSMGA